MLVYVDSSVLARAYLHDEPGHDDATALLGGDHLLVTSTLTVIEVTSALIRADRARRLADLDAVLRVLDRDVAPDGTVTVITGEQSLIEASALHIVRHLGLGTLDALHLAVADLSARRLAGDQEDVAFASRDGSQRAAAAGMGFVTV